MAKRPTMMMSSSRLHAGAKAVPAALVLAALAAAPALAALAALLLAPSAAVWKLARRPPQIDRLIAR